MKWIFSIIVAAMVTASAVTAAGENNIVIGTIDRIEDSNIAVVELSIDGKYIKMVDIPVVDFEESITEGDVINILGNVEDILKSSARL